MTKIRILFVCETNSIRSQAAEALLRHTDATHFEASSAGLEPEPVNLRAVAALERAGVDASGLRSKSLAEVGGERFDCVIILCAKSEASEYDMLNDYVQGGQIMTWDFGDPLSNSDADAFRHMLHELHERIKLLVLIKTKPPGARPIAAHQPERRLQSSSSQGTW
jgi:protein-tyrosine-phosphatase